MTATPRNTGKRNSRSSATAPKRNGRRALSKHGVGAVALAVAGLVMAAGHGCPAVAVLGAVALYMLVKGRRGPVAGSGTYARQALRLIAWGVVALAVTASSQGSMAPGGPVLGLAFAAGLATALVLTATGSRRSATPNSK